MGTVIAPSAFDDRLDECIENASPLCYSSALWSQLDCVSLLANHGNDVYREIAQFENRDIPILMRDGVGRKYVEESIEADSDHTSERVKVVV